MKSKAPKLPGKFCRVLSFIPWINWLSVLYIGIVNTNALHVICGIVYAVVTFAVPSTAPFLWIVGIVHYIFAYRSIKKRMSSAEALPVKPQEKANIHSPSPTAPSFSDMGADQLLTPREVTRDFLGLLNILHQNPELSFDTLVNEKGFSVQSAEQNPEEVPDKEDELFAEFDI